MFSAWAAIPIRSWAAVIMSAAAEQPPHTLPPPGANFCCFRLREGIKTSRKRDGLSVSSYFFLGSQSSWSRVVTEQGCLLWAREVRGFLPNLLKTPTHQLCRTPSKLPHAKNVPLLSCSSCWDFGRLHFSPWVSFAHTALCGGEVHTHPVLGVSLFFPSIMSYEGNIILVLSLSIHV